MAALRPKRSTLLWWQFAGIAVVGVTGVGLRTLGLAQWVQPALYSFMVAAVFDQFVLRGAVFETVYRAAFPVYEEKVLRHEAGHFLIAYLMGCPVRGYVINALDAMRLGLPGQSVTLFSDADVQRELAKNKLSDSSIDRYAVVLMAGIAGEALHYGQAEGGAADETALVALLTSFAPPWRRERILNKARWGALQAILLLRKYRVAYEVLVEKMAQKEPLGKCIQAIEENILPAEVVLVTAPSEPESTDEGVTEAQLVQHVHDLTQREQELEDRQLELERKEDELNAREKGS